MTRRSGRTPIARRAEEVIAIVSLHTFSSGGPRHLGERVVEHVLHARISRASISMSNLPGVAGATERLVDQ